MSTEIKTGNLPVNINSNNSSKTAKSSGENNTVGSSQNQQTVNHSKGNDTISLTSQVSRLQSIEAQLSSIPAVNEAKVAEIKAAIADGSFEINPQNIAAKLIEMESS